MAELAGPEVARNWYIGLFDAFATLSQNPRRQAIIAENSRFRREVRQLLYRRTTAGPIWRLLFTVVDGEYDAPTVNLLHVRHGAQRPITRAEARQIEAQG